MEWKREEKREEEQKRRNGSAAKKEEQLFIVLSQEFRKDELLETDIDSPDVRFREILPKTKGPVEVLRPSLASVGSVFGPGSFSVEVDLELETFEPESKSGPFRILFCREFTKVEDGNLLEVVRRVRVGNYIPWDQGQVVWN